MAGTAAAVCQRSDSVMLEIVFEVPTTAERLGRMRSIAV
jgi:hypothetical protein